MLASISHAIRTYSPGQIAGIVHKTIRHEIRMRSPEGRRFRERLTAFDRKWGTETTADVKLYELSVPKGADQHCRWYAAAIGDDVDAEFDHLALDFSRYTFIDYGSGKGKVLFLAALRGFKACIGVEFAPELCAIAERNTGIFLSKAGPMPPIQTIHSDARAYEPPAGPLVVFIYNSFDATIMKPVMERLERSYDADPREVIVLYMNPEFARLYRESPRWRTEDRPNVLVARLVPTA
jgi:SAM-dependent methyltransferase